jgi:photosystem II stability/assembly factor-like uncharacterized protein
MYAEKSDNIVLEFPLNLPTPFVFITALFRLPMAAQNTQKRNRTLWAFTLPFFLIAFFFSFTMPAQAQWRKVASHVFLPYWEYGLEMANNHGVIWASARFQNTIVYSLDTGKTWITKFTGNYATKINFYDSLNGVMSVNYGQVWATTDGGATWSNLPKLIGGSAAVTFAGSPMNIVSTSVGTGIYTTTDGGLTAVKSYTPAGNSPFGGTPDIAFAPPSTVATLDIGNNNAIVSSTDKGLTWTARHQNISLFYNWNLGFDRCDPSVLYLADPQLIVGTGTIYITKDLGVTLTQANPPGITNGSISISPNAVFFQTLDKGVIRTTDQGATWTVIGGPSMGVENRGVCAINNNTLIAVDNNGDVWRTDNCGGFPLSSTPPEMFIYR